MNQLLNKNLLELHFNLELEIQQCRNNLQGMDQLENLPKLYCYHCNKTQLCKLYSLLLTISAC